MTTAPSPLVFITGASSGIGQALAARFYDAGYRLALVPFLALPRSGAPYLFCVIPYDQAGNPGLLVERILP